jgi:uncharacterized membrane protein YqaE (UPF0057 family)
MRAVHPGKSDQAVGCDPLSAEQAAPPHRGNRSPQRHVDSAEHGRRRPTGRRLCLEPRRAVDLIRIVLAILLPPLGVFLQVGLGGQFWLNILLTLLGCIPGIVHAVWIIARR